MTFFIFTAEPQLGARRLGSHNNTKYILLEVCNSKNTVQNGKTMMVIDDDNHSQYWYSLKHRRHKISVCSSRQELNFLFFVILLLFVSVYLFHFNLYLIMLRLELHQWNFFCFEARVTNPFGIYFLSQKVESRFCKSSAHSMEPKIASGFTQDGLVVVMNFSMTITTGIYWWGIWVLWIEDH